MQWWESLRGFSKSATGGECISHPVYCAHCIMSETIMSICIVRPQKPTSLII